MKGAVMANLQNCGLCGSRERPSDLHFGQWGKYICDNCEQDVFEMFDDPQAAVEYIRNAPVAAPKDIFGAPMHEPRFEPALALGGWTVFCSCGKLTGFADTRTDA
jgi:hypothetical protein